MGSLKTLISEHLTHRSQQPQGKFQNSLEDALGSKPLGKCGVLSYKQACSVISEKSGLCLHHHDKSLFTQEKDRKIHLGSQLQSIMAEGHGKVKLSLGEARRQRERTPQRA